MDETARKGAGAPDPAGPERRTALPGRVEPPRKETAPPSAVAAEPKAPADNGTWPAPDPAGSAAGRAETDPAIKSAGIWLNMFSRTVKTCRLYEAANPTVLKFRDELAAALSAMVERHGAVTYRFTAEEVTCEGQSLYTTRSRDSSLSFAFYRDGVRGLTFQPGVDERECNAVVNAVLGVTGQNLDGDDLVTVLWEANLRHVDVDYIPIEGESGSADGAASGASEDAGPLLPWPTAEGGRDPGDASGADGGESTSDVSAGEERSEDWALGELTHEIEATFAELDSMSEQELKRFTFEYEAERRVPPPTAALAVVDACLHTEANDDDRLELMRFLPRVLRASLTAGVWTDAREALRLLRETNTGEWSEETFTQEVLQPVSITRTVEKLDGQGPTSVAEFLALANELGGATLDWLTLALSESRTRMTRQLVAEAITVHAQADPARLAPWLNDARWFVVRNVVHILGWVGGPGVVPLLLTAVRYPDTRVTTAVVAALKDVEPRLARPVLIKALEVADTKLLCQILQQLSAARDPAVARYVTAFLSQERFLQRPAEERRALYAAVASTGGNEVVEELEQMMNGGNWFDREHELHRHAVAHCLAHIGTPRALAALDAGTRSRRAPVRQACIAAMQSSRKAA